MSESLVKRTFVDELPVPPTNEERVALAEDLVDVLAAGDRLAEHFKAMKERYKNRAEGYAQDALEVRQALVKGTKRAEVECEATFDYLTGTVVVRRVDTGEELERREMTPDERQSRLALLEDD